MRTKYIKPHLSPELRAQITPMHRRDVKLVSAGIFFLVTSSLLAYNLWPKGPSSTLSNNNSPVAFEQKQVLGVSTQEKATPSEAQFTQYTVKNGDTLFNISQEYNIRWDSIAQINNLAEPYVVHGGQILKIPQATTSTVPNKVYTVGNGDTLASIAKQYNITVADIIAVNPNLQKSDLITTGQIIKLP